MCQATSSQPILDELAGRLGTRRGTGPTLEDERLGQEKLPDLNLTDSPD